MSGEAKSGNIPVREYSLTGTVPIPREGMDRKTLPVICSWCNDLTGVAKVSYMDEGKVAPLYRICARCMDYLNRKAVFPEVPGTGNMN